MKKGFRLLIHLFDKMSEGLRCIKIPARLIISHVLVSMIPVIVVASYSGYITQELVLVKMNDFSVQIAKSINYDIKRYMADLLDIYSSDGLKKIGEIYITVTEKSLIENYNQIDFGMGLSVCLIDSSGKMISSHAKENAFSAMDLLDGIETANNDNQGSFDLKTKGEEYAVAFNKMENIDWYVACLVPYSYLNTAVKEQKRYIYICAAICLLACTLFALVMYRSIVVPLNNLRNHMVHAEKDNLLEKITDNNRDEIADVAKSLNNLIDEMKELIDDVHRSEQQKSAEKLKALQAQINPHFLSNALNTVKWMASLQNADNIENLTTALIQLLQVSMGKVEDLVPLSKEIDYIRHYVEIQSYRYWDKLTVEYDIDKEAGDCLLPPFSIQPIVENAIIHGIEPKAGKGTIWINASRIGEEVVCVVKDNGIGFSDCRSWDAADKADPKHTSGIGIKNANERIKMFFGQDYGITYESIPGIYTKIKVRIPYTVKN